MANINFQSSIFVEISVNRDFFSEIRDQKHPFFKLSSMENVFKMPPS
jgi:hypothetical protein